MKNKLKKLIDFPSLILISILFIFGYMFYNYTVLQPKLNNELINVTNEYQNLNKYIEFKLQNIQTVKQSQSEILEQQEKLIIRLKKLATNEDKTFDY